MAAPFGDTLMLEREGEGVWRGQADPAFANGVEGKLLGQFGGWTAAVVLKALAGEAPAGNRVRTFTIHYLSAVRQGALSVRTAPLRQGRSVAFWQAQLFQGEDVRAHAVATFGEDRMDAHAHTFSSPPDAPPADTPGLPVGGPPGKLGESIGGVWVKGPPFASDRSAHSIFWSYVKPPTLLDAPKLALLADNMPPRVFYVANAFVPNTTLSLSLYVHATAQELALVGEGKVLTEVRGRRIESGYWDHTASFWSASGALLATSEQLAMHRG